jgi:hypothetical protein
MNHLDAFLSFIDELKTETNNSLLESIKSGFFACFEAEIRPKFIQKSSKYGNYSYQDWYEELKKYAKKYLNIRKLEDLNIFFDLEKYYQKNYSVYRMLKVIKKELKETVGHIKDAAGKGEKSTEKSINGKESDTMKGMKAAADVSGPFAIAHALLSVPKMIRRFRGD